jgi:PilZ domain
MREPIRERRGDGIAGATAGTDVADRRSTPRQQFVAEAHVVEISSGVKLSARSCDLGPNGCYVDTLMPFPVGTPVRIRLSKAQTSIELNGKVVYQLTGLGMGIAFHEVSSENRAVLEKWFGEPRKQVSVETSLPPVGTSRPLESRRLPPAEFVELVRLLMKKEILTKTEAITLLNASDE